MVAKKIAQKLAKPSCLILYSFKESFIFAQHFSTPSHSQTSTLMLNFAFFQIAQIAAILTRFETHWYSKSEEKPIKCQKFEFSRAKCSKKCTFTKPPKDANEKNYHRLKKKKWIKNKNVRKEEN